MVRLYSYVVDHDLGRSPNPYGGYCSLALCKFGSPARRNLVEMAQVGDWVAGTGGASSQSAGRGRLVYAMRVEEKFDLADYSNAPRFYRRADAIADPYDYPGRFALVSRHFFYFGSSAVDLSALPTHHLSCPFEKAGRGYRHKGFSPQFIADFAAWLSANYHVGVHGVPCGGLPTHAPRTVCHTTQPTATVSAAPNAELGGAADTDALGLSATTLFLRRLCR